jgi:hypothetical protein
MVVWRNHDSFKDDSGNGRPLSQHPAALQAVARLSADKTNSTPSWGYFFEGCDYVFIDNQATKAGRARNNSCTGKRQGIRRKGQH